MKNIFICLILLSMIFSYNTGYSGMYFSDGFTLSGSYSNQEEDGEKSEALGLGFSYLAFQKEVNSSDKPTLFQGGSLEISGFYNSIDTDGLNMKMLSIGLGYYFNNLRFGFHYETLHDYSGDEVDYLNDLTNNTLEMSGYGQTFSIGFYRNEYLTPKFVFIPFIDLMRTDSEISMSFIDPYGNDINIDADGSANLLRFGAAFKMNDFVIQPMVTMNEGKDKRYSISAIFKL